MNRNDLIKILDMNPKVGHAIGLAASHAAMMQKHLETQFALDEASYYGATPDAVCLDSCSFFEHKTAAQAAKSLFEIKKLDDFGPVPIGKDWEADLPNQRKELTPSQRSKRSTKNKLAKSARKANRKS